MMDWQVLCIIGVTGIMFLAAIVAYDVMWDEPRH